MGYDISYHPVDVAFLRDRVAPYVRGKGNLDDVIPDMGRIEKVRGRAGAWALKVVDIYHKEVQRQRDAEEFARSAARSAVAGKSVARPKKVPARPLPGWFDPDLHVWGRPFFITARTPEEVSDRIDRYCAAGSDAEVDALAREEVARLNPTLAQRMGPA